MYHDLKVGIRLECSSSRETASEAIALNRGGGEGGEGVVGSFMELYQLGQAPVLSYSNTNLGVAVKVLCRHN